MVCRILKTQLGRELFLFIKESENFHNFYYIDYPAIFSVFFEFKKAIKAEISNQGFYYMVGIYGARKPTHRFKNFLYLLIFLSCDHQETL